ncbi:polysaccharide pyruvyl transferase family protein [Collimonas sp.]|jgi:polysaccharide pyruvyl transferase WcaK-like protein|uniref:polysaccharide pyruvyl transferase family protein n=1 Tax=Collimonas sp. TaxID=1963772 RepID=UPI002BB31A68|nr:polysaccharide pyruvyl transferase family protein [Collimonas sp.]HWW04760.1 polysaccharide pyruvyl transferase family protein [Collimonas sp.]
MKIVIAAVPFSPNLGDGIIYENIRQLMLEHMPNAQVSALDIAGRDDYEAPGVSRKTLISKVPKWSRPYLVCAYFSIQYFLRWRRKWLGQLADADLIVIGGGQLFLDVNLNFPIKLFLLSKTIKAAGKSGKVAILGVGVATTMSGAGTGLLRRTLANLAPVQISTRDSASAHNLQQILAAKLVVRVTPDPGIYSKQTYARSLPVRTPGEVLGICISSPLELNQLGSEGADYAQRIGLYFQQLARQAVEMGYRVLLFTNGSGDDETFKETLATDLDPNTVLSLPRPDLPAQLVANIANCDCIVAHRLHANIVAYALDIPSIGLSWDSKIKSFFKQTGRDRFFIPAPIPDVRRTLSLLDHARRSRATTKKPELTQQLTSEIAALLNASSPSSAVVLPADASAAATATA